MARRSLLGSTRPPLPRLGVTGEWRGRDFCVSLSRSTAVCGMKFPHKCVRPLLDPSKQPPGLPRCLSPLERNAEFWHIFLKAPDPMLILSLEVASEPNMLPKPYAPPSHNTWKMHLNRTGALEGGACFR